MVILRSQNKITDFFMILAWASPFKHILPCLIYSFDSVGSFEYLYAIGIKYHDNSIFLAVHTSPVCMFTRYFRL